MKILTNYFSEWCLRELQAQKNSGNDQLEEHGNLISTLEVISYKILPTWKVTMFTYYKE